MADCVSNPQFCVGCGACEAVCPKKAVRLALNEDGFITAQLDKTKCIQCGKCLQVCPKFAEQLGVSPHFEDIPLYAVSSQDRLEQETSASGGAAAEITKWAFANGYIVAGTVYDYQHQQAKTMIAENYEQARAFKGSKYLQSDFSHVFDDILKRKEKMVVFGTPCQIAALHLAAKITGRRKDLVLVDFFCHGIPSYLLWNAFLQSLPQTVRQIRFRHKKYGWHAYTMEINGQILPQRKNPFYTLFFSDCFLGPQCYACPSRQSFACADIRLGDFWGSQFDLREDGVSAFCAITAKGQEVFEALKGGLRIYPFAAAHELCRKSQQAFGPKAVPWQREHLMSCLKNGESIARVQQAYAASLPFQKRIAACVKKYLPSRVRNLLRFWCHKKTERTIC